MNVDRRRLGAIVFGVTVVLAGCGGHGSSFPAPTTAPSSATTTGSTVAKVDLNTAGPCDLFSQAEAESIAGRALPGHLIEPLPLPGGIGTAQDCTYADAQDNANINILLGLGVATFPAAGASLDHMLAKGYTDVSAQFGLPSGYSTRSGGLAVIVDPKHSLTALAEARGPDNTKVFDEAKAIAAMHIALRHLQ